MFPICSRNVLEMSPSVVLQGEDYSTETNGWVVDRTLQSLDLLSPSQCEFFDPASDRWIAGPPMNTLRACHSLAVPDGRCSVMCKWRFVKSLCTRNRRWTSNESTLVLMHLAAMGGNTNGVACKPGSRCWVVPHERIVRLAANVGDRQVQQPRDDRSQ